MKSVWRSGIAVVLLALLSGTSVWAVWSTNTRTTDGGGCSGDCANTAAWVPALQPGEYDQV